MDNKLKVVNEPLSVLDTGINNQLTQYRDSREISFAYILSLMVLKHCKSHEDNEGGESRVVIVGDWTLWVHNSKYPQGCQPTRKHASAHCNAMQVCVWHKGQFIAILKPEGGHSMTHFSIQDKGSGQPIEDVFIQEMEDALREREKMIASHHKATLKLLK